MQPIVKYQREVDLQWRDRIKTLPGCERVASCIQCGTCSGTCPVSTYMDYTPRKMMALIREGFREEALESKTIWLCASCYSCTVRCPQHIHITDVMYSLKREAIKTRKYPGRFPIPVLAQEFFERVRKDGRSAEVLVVVRMALRSHPGILLTMMKSGWQLLRAGRIHLRREHIKDAATLRRALAAAREGTND